VALRFLVVSSRRLRRQSESAQIGHDDGMFLDKCSRQRNPHISGRAKAVQQHDRGSFTANPSVDRCAIGFNLAGLKSGGESNSIVTVIAKLHGVLLI
jgi:hypothetical protein